MNPAPPCSAATPALKDPLFTTEGYRAYADDLLERMVRPNLNDMVWRICRDHVRKLGYDDRLYGTMRLALQYSIQPRNLASGAAAAVLSMIRRRDTIQPPVDHLPVDARELTQDALAHLLRALWAAKADQHADTLIRLTWEGVQTLHGSPQV